MAFLTNNASKSRRSYVQRLAAAGIPDVDPRDILAASWAAAEWLVDQGWGRDGYRALRGEKALCIGAAGLREELEAAGVSVADPVGSQGGGADWSSAGLAAWRPDPAVTVVVVGHDEDFDYGRLCEAALYCRARPRGAGATLVVTNPDAGDVVASGGSPGDPARIERVMPGTGALLAAIETASGTEGIVVGKGGAWLPARLPALLGVEDDPRRAILVGDRLDTDVAVAASAGLRSLLVMTGSSDAADLAAATTAVNGKTASLAVPDAWAPSIVTLADTLV